MALRALRPPRARLPRPLQSHLPARLPAQVTYDYKPLDFEVNRKWWRRPIVRASGIAAGSALVVKTDVQGGMPPDDTCENEGEPIYVPMNNTCEGGWEGGDVLRPASCSAAARGLSAACACRPTAAADAAAALPSNLRLALVQLLCGADTFYACAQPTPLPYREPKCEPPALEGFAGGAAAAASGDWQLGWEVTANGTRNWTCSDGQPAFFGAKCELADGGAWAVGQQSDAPLARHLGAWLVGACAAGRQARACRGRGLLRTNAAAPPILHSFPPHPAPAQQAAASTQSRSRAWRRGRWATLWSSGTAAPTGWTR